MVAEEEEINRELASAGPQRIWYVGQAFRQGYTQQDVFNLTKIDPWFLAQIEDLIKTEQSLSLLKLDDLDAEKMRGLKRRITG